MNKEIELWPTQIAFLQSDAPIRSIIGSAGEGKTYASLAAILDAADKRYKGGGGLLRACLIRDTYDNIRRMTAPSLQEACNYMGIPMKWTNANKTLQISTADIDLVGIDSLNDLSKVGSGSEYSFIWLEEPAPIAERVNAGLAEEVFNIAVYRCTRQRAVKGVIPRLIISMNPADEEHWTYRRLILDPYELGKDPDFPDIWAEVFFTKYGENKALTDLQRQAVKAAYKSDKAGWQRFVEGKFAYQMWGEKVVPNYKDEIHLSKNTLAPITGETVYRGWDGWFNPSVVFAQFQGSRFCVLDTIAMSNSDTKTLIKSKVIPLINTRYKHIKSWDDIADPSMFTGDQSDKFKCPANDIRDFLNGSPRPGVQLWEPRRLAIIESFNRLDPIVQISPHDKVMQRVLGGGWHYKKDNTGKVTKDVPIQDQWSHPGAALSYIISRVFEQPQSNVWNSFFGKKKSLAESYPCRRQERRAHV